MQRLVAAIALMAALAPRATALEHPLADLDRDFDLRSWDLVSLIEAVRNARAGGAWNARADVNHDGRLDHNDIAPLLDQLARALSTDPWRLLTVAEQDIFAERWGQARDRLQWLVQMRGSWPQTHGLLAVAYHGLAAETNGPTDVALRCYRDFAEAWRLRALGVADAAETSYDARMMLLINGERLARDLPPMLPHPEVALAGYNHSAYMQDRDELTHFEDNPTTHSPWDRIVLEMGCEPRGAAENVGFWEATAGLEDPASVQGLHDGFMASEHHRANILSPDLVYMGVAIRASRTKMWCTEDFMTIDRPCGLCPGHQPQ